MRNLIILFGFGLLAALCSEQAVALSITCSDDPTDERHATLDSADDCWIGLGNPSSGDLQGHAPGDAWLDVGRIEGESESLDAANGFLMWTFGTGAWGGGDFTGTWSIDPEFWNIYSEAIITIHVGHGNGGPDYFAFLITPGDISGTLAYSMCGTCTGGGFSNMVLWGRGVAVPEPGTLALFGVGLLILGFVRRRRLQPSAH